MLYFIIIIIIFFFFFGCILTWRIRFYQLPCVSSYISQWDNCIDGDWSVFEFSDPTYEPVGYAIEASADEGPKCDHKAGKPKRNFK